MATSIPVHTSRKAHTLAPAPYKARTHPYMSHPPKPFLALTHRRSRAVHTRHTKAYSRFTAAHAGFYTSSASSAHAHTHTHEFRTRHPHMFQGIDLTRSIDPCLFNMALPVPARFQTGWATFVAMKDDFDQCLYRPQMEVAREALQARDLLIDLDKVDLHPALRGQWKVVSDLNVEIVEALKLKQPVLVALFIARRLGEATASEKIGAIRTAHAQLKELKTMGGKGGFAELANWAILPLRPRWSG